MRAFKVYELLRIFYSSTIVYREKTQLLPPIVVEGVPSQGITEKVIQLGRNALMAVNIVDFILMRPDEEKTGTRITGSGIHSDRVDPKRQILEALLFLQADLEPFHIKYDHVYSASGQEKWMNTIEHLLTAKIINTY
jgi:hypothetical protein